MMVVLHSALVRLESSLEYLFLTGSSLVSSTTSHPSHLSRPLLDNPTLLRICCLSLPYPGTFEFLLPACHYFTPFRSNGTLHPPYHHTPLSLYPFPYPPSSSSISDFPSAKFPSFSPHHIRRAFISFSPPLLSLNPSIPLLWAPSIPPTYPLLPSTLPPQR